MNAAYTRDGWAVRTIADVAGKPQYGWTTRAKLGRGVKLLRTTDITSGRIDWDSVPVCDEPPPDLGKYELRPGDIVVSRAGSVGFSALIDSSCPPSTVFASYLMRIHPNPEVASPQFVYQFMQSPNYWQQIADASVGIGLANVNGSKLAALELPVPSIPEQDRITSLLHRTSERHRRARLRIGQAKDLLVSFDRAVATAATDGSLTEDWRAASSSRESATALLARIRADVLSSRPKRRRINSIDLDPAPFALPESWAWASLADVCTSVTDGDHQPPPKAASGIPFVVIGNLRSGQLDLSETMHVPKSYYAKLDHSRKARLGDVLYTVTGSYGMAVLVETDQQFCFQRHIALARPHPSISGSYLQLALSAPATFNQATQVATGIAQLTVPLSGLRALRLPIPPAEEQEEVVRRARELQKRRAHIVGLTEAADSALSQGMDALVASAFRGELLFNGSTPPGGRHG